MGITQELGPSPSQHREGQSYSSSWNALRPPSDYDIEDDSMSTANHSDCDHVNEETHPYFQPAESPSHLPPNNGPTAGFNGDPSSSFQENVSSTTSSGSLVEMCGCAHDSSKCPRQIPSSIEGQGQFLTDEEVIRILDLRRSGTSYPKIAKIFGPCTSQQVKYDPRTLRSRLRAAIVAYQTNRRLQPRDVKIALERIEIRSNYHSLAIEACERLKSPTWNQIWTYIDSNNVPYSEKGVWTMFSRLKCFPGKEAEHGKIYSHDEALCKIRVRLPF
ncbi:hypothetical protein IG631_22481 [Alternaria alternata]|nr:hypothetical protein IG631_22481 [Alternaria alternata]